MLKKKAVVFDGEISYFAYEIDFILKAISSNIER